MSATWPTGPEHRDPPNLLGQIMTEAGQYLRSDILPENLLIEQAIRNVDLEDIRYPGRARNGSDLVRTELKLFLQFLARFKRVSAYARHATLLATECRLDLSSVEDDAYLYERERQRAEAKV